VSLAIDLWYASVVLVHAPQAFPATPGWSNRVRRSDGGRSAYADCIDDNERDPDQPDGRVAMSN